MIGSAVHNPLTTIRSSSPNGLINFLPLLEEEEAESRRTISQPVEPMLKITNAVKRAPKLDRYSKELDSQPDGRSNRICTQDGSPPLLTL